MDLRRPWTMAEETGLGRRLPSVLGLLHQRRRRSSRRRELILPPASLACEVDGEDLSPFLWTAQQVEISPSSPHGRPWSFGTRAAAMAAALVPCL
nr:hypothetical protein Iba_chr04aCG16320 [Ipomoea batatas]